jgi:osmotically-inducible protein OsmY
MNTRSYSVKFVALLLGCPLCVAAETLFGTVVDGANQNLGIAGVTVTALASDGTSIKSSITDTRGRYSIELGTPASKVRSDKLGYLNRNATRLVMSMKQEQPPIYLAKERAEIAYYDGIRTSFNASSADVRAQYAAIVAALPSETREQISAKLDSPAKAQLLAAGVAQRLNSTPGAEGVEVHVETFKGVVQLSGFATTATAKEEAAAQAKMVKGVQTIKNDIRIGRIGN